MLAHSPTAGLTWAPLACRSVSAVACVIAEWSPCCLPLRSTWSKTRSSCSEDSGMDTKTKELLDHFHRTIDALVAIKLDLSCHDGVDESAAVITGATARRACTEIDRAIQDIRSTAMTLRGMGGAD